MEGSGIARLLVRYMNALALELPALEPAAGVAAANAALELLRAAIEPQLPTEPGRRARGVARRDRPLRAHAPTGSGSRSGVDRPRLCDVGARAARAVRGRRCVGRRAGAQRASCPLPGGPAARNGGSVTDIAFRWGFCDAAHFSRVFKREFGATPSEVRQGATAARLEAD